MEEKIDSYLKDLEDAEKTPTSNEFPFNLLSKRISFLVKACEILNNHPEELESSCQEAMKKRGFPPSAMLTDYILLDINSFYECAKTKFPKLTLPETAKPVERFRHNILGHFQRSNNAGVVEEYKIINKVGLIKIHGEWLEFRDTIFSKLK